MPLTGFSVNLNTIHERAGGTSETTCSLNDTDIKNLKFSGTGSALGDHTASLAESYVVGNVSGGTAGGFYGYSEGDTDIDDQGTSHGSLAICWTRPTACLIMRWRWIR